MIFIIILLDFSLAMGSSNLGLIVIILFVISNLQSLVHCINNNLQDLDDLIVSQVARGHTRRHTGSLYNISLPSNITDIKASVVTVRNSMFWRKGANYSGIIIPPRVRTTPYAKRIAFVYESFGVRASSVYFRLPNNSYSFVSPVIGFTVYDARNNTNDVKTLNLSIKKDNPILIKFDYGGSSNVKCVAFGENGLMNLISNTTRDNECATTNSRGHFVLVVLNHKSKHKSKLVKRKWWWFGLVGVLVMVCLVIFVVVKLVKKKRLRDRERESEKGEMIGNIWIGRSRMPAATMVRTQPSLEFHEDLPSSSNIY